MKYYRDLLRQVGRIEAFRRAIHDAVGVDDRVLEVGTGVGTYAFFASDAGAARVWAVDGHPVVHVAETIARLNGYADKVQFLRGWIPDVTIPDRASVLIFEDFPTRLADSRVFRLFSDLHKSYLTADAAVVPSGAALYLAPMDTADVVEPIGDCGDTAYGIDWAASREYLVNTPRQCSLSETCLAAVPIEVSTIEFAAPPDQWCLGGSASWLLQRDSVVTGLAYWFDLHLNRRERISNAPGADPASWGQLVLPLDPPLRVPAGSELRAAVSVEKFPDGAPGWLSWAATAAGQRSGGHEFRSEPASFADLYSRSPDATPRLNALGALEAEVLRLTDGARTVAEIAREVCRTRPALSEVAAQSLAIGMLQDKLEQIKLSEIRREGGTDG